MDAEALARELAITKKLGRTPEDLICDWTEKDEDGRELRLFRHNGKLYPAFGDLGFGQLKAMDMRDDDIFLVGYLKTGCHWTYEILTMLLHARPTLSQKTKMEAFVDFAHPKVISALSSPRVLNSHLEFRELPTQMLEKKTKLVLTVRNPKDTAVSLYHHHTKLPVYGYDGPFNKWFPLFLEGRSDYGSYFDYYKSWDEAVKANPDHPIIVMSYEDMKEGRKSEIISPVSL